MNSMKSERFPRSDRLLSWVGVTDYQHFRGSKQGSPLVAVARLVRPRRIDLLWGDSDKIPSRSADEYRKWLRQQLRDVTPNVLVTVHRLPASPAVNVMNFEWVFSNVERHFAELDESSETAVNASSGTWIMSAAWIVWAKTLPNRKVRLYISSVEAGAQPLELPPGLRIDLHRLLTVREDDPLLERLLTGWSPPESIAEFHGTSKAMRRVLYSVERVAPYRIPVLLCGEAGTGKSMLASALHKLGNGDDSPFVVVDCGQLFGPTEIHNVFGWKKGAFTGAISDNPGLIHKAQGGTLFFDEIGNAPPEIQANLLRILQEKKHRPLGSLEEEECSARIVAATNARLADLLRSGKFRQDLLDRLSGVVIEIPPLRDRGNDIVELARHKLREFQREPRNQSAMRESGIVEKVLSATAEREMRSYDWPGNVRELEHVIARLVIFGDPLSDKISAQDVRRELKGGPTTSSCGLLNRELGGSFRLDDVVLEVQEHYVRAALRAAGGNKTKAARLLGFGTRTPLFTILNNLKNAGRSVYSREN